MTKHCLWKVSLIYFYIKGQCGTIKAIEVLMISWDYEIANANNLNNRPLQLSLMLKKGQ